MLPDSKVEQTFSVMGYSACARGRLPGRLRPEALGCPLPEWYPGCPLPDPSMQSRQCGASPSLQAALGGNCAKAFSTWQAPQVLPSPGRTACNTHRTRVAKQ